MAAPGSLSAPTMAAHPARPATAAAAAAPALRTPLRHHFESIPAGWRELAAAFAASADCEALCRFVDGRVTAGATVYPELPLAALQATALEQVGVVILGQDPYHGPGQAHGLAFSVRDGVRAPPSLRNILGEVACDCSCARGASVNLQRWARQGVLLLNAVLTVEQGAPGSHARRGWETFTAALVAQLAADGRPKAFLLWGLQAQAFGPRIVAAGHQHAILKANHPSPLSARRGPAPFIGCRHFSQANDFLVQRGRPAVDWCAAPERPA
jgi:uracil-DNA glycosylase